jgi:hypothetical protein
MATKKKLDAIEPAYPRIDYEHDIAKANRSDITIDIIDSNIRASKNWLRDVLIKSVVEPANGRWDIEIIHAAPSDGKCVIRARDTATGGHGIIDLGVVIDR